MKDLDWTVVVFALLLIGILLAFTANSCSAGTLYSNPEAPVGMTGVTPYTHLSEHTQTLGLNLLIPTTNRLTLHLGASHTWNEPREDLTASYTTSLVEDQDEITTISLTSYQLSTLEDTSWSMTAGFTLWIGSPSRDDTIILEHETPHVTEWPE